MKANASTILRIATLRERMHSTTAVLTNAPEKADEKSETIQKLKTKQSTAAVAMLLCSRLCGNPLSNGMRAQLGDERCRQKSTSKQLTVQPPVQPAFWCNPEIAGRDGLKRGWIHPAPNVFFGRPRTSHIRQYRRGTATARASATSARRS